MTTARAGQPTSLTGDPLTDQLVPVVQQLIGAAQDLDEVSVAAAFHRAATIVGDWATGAATLAIIAAAMVPSDRSPSALLRWLTQRCAHCGGPRGTNRKYCQAKCRDDAGRVVAAQRRADWAADVAQLSADGRGVTEIARALHLGVSTVNRLRRDIEQQRLVGAGVNSDTAALLAGERPASKEAG